MTPPTANRVRKWLLPLGVVLALSVGAISGAMDVEEGSAVHTGILLSVLGVGLAISLLWWRLADEVVREAHKTAWFWGGSSGMLLALIGAVFVPEVAPALIERAESPAELLKFGVLAAALAQIAGYLLAWAGWWASRR
jgi:hypothetical protein